MKKYLLAFSIVLLLSSAVMAQEGFFERFVFGPDTIYAVRHPYRYTIRPNVGTSFGQFTSNWDDGGLPHSYSLMSAPIFKAGCSVSYLGITAGIHRDVKRLFGETEETEYSFSGYTPIVGGEVSYSSSHAHTMSSNADGVPVAIVNDHPHHSNGDILDAYLWLIGEAKRGVNVFLFNGGFHHSKVMSIDDDCCMIGSDNLESRSLFYDHEQNAIVVDTALVNDFVEIYEADKLNSDTLTRELYKSATPWKRFVGRLAVFLRPIL